MHIGLTYDLRDEYLKAGYSLEEVAELDSAETIEALATALAECGHVVEKIGGISGLVNALAQGRRWDLVFNIAEGFHGAARESQVPALLDAYQIPYTFSDPLTLSYCLDKSTTKVLLQRHGLATPKHLLFTGDVNTFTTQLAELRFPLFAKPVAEGTSKGVTEQSRCTDTPSVLQVCSSLYREFRQAVLVEEYLPGREFTAGILGTGSQAKMLGALEISYREGAESGAYTFKNKEQCETLIRYTLLDSADPVYGEVQELALACWSALGCRDAGRVDIRCDASGAPQIIEVNPLAGLHPTHSDLPMIATALEMSYQELITSIITSASERSNAAYPCKTEHTKSLAHVTACL